MGVIVVGEKSLEKEVDQRQIEKKLGKRENWVIPEGWDKGLRQRARIP